MCVGCAIYHCHGKCKDGGSMRCVHRSEEPNFGGLVAQWITRLTTDQKIPGSNPGRFGIFVGQGQGNYICIHTYN